MPIAVYVGPAHNALRDVNGEAVYEDYRAYSPTEYIIPNAPETMLNLTEDITEGELGFAETLRYFGESEADFISALRRMHSGESNCCICFPRLNRKLSDDGWRGAAMYILSRQFPIDYMDIFHMTALPLLDYPTDHYFTLASSVGGRFSDLEHNPLKPLLRRYFGPNLDMKQTI